MNQDKVREKLEAQIKKLVSARDESNDANERAAASEAIGVLQDEVDDLNINVADNLGERIDAIIARMDEILNEKALDAGSALGRTIRKLRESLDDPSAVK